LLHFAAKYIVNFIALLALWTNALSRPHSAFNPLAAERVPEFLREPSLKETNGISDLHEVIVENLLTDAFAELVKHLPALFGTVAVSVVAELQVVYHL
jgi:hypothetical protein